MTVRKVKTMQKILEENKNSHFGERGELLEGINSTFWFINPATFKDLGKETNNPQLWEECLLEPLPEKKEKRLYAYRRGERIILLTCECISFTPHSGRGSYQRDPSYDPLCRDPENGIQAELPHEFTTITRTVLDSGGSKDKGERNA